MPRKVKKPLCTMFIRSDTEKKIWKAAKEYEKQEAEIADLKEQVALLKDLVVKANSGEPIETVDSEEEEESPKPKRKLKVK